MPVLFSKPIKFRTSDITIKEMMFNGNILLRIRDPHFKSNRWSKAEESTSRMELEEYPLPNDVEKELRKFRINKDDVEEHIWEFHSSPHCERDKSVKFHSYYITDDIDDVVKYLNTIKSQNIVGILAPFINNHIEDDDMITGQAYRIHFGGISR